MHITLERDGTLLSLEEETISIMQGFTRLEAEIPIFTFKKLFLKSFALGVSQTFGTYHYKVDFYKVNSKYTKVYIRIENDVGKMSFPIFHNEVAGLVIMLKNLHQEKEETNICSEQVKVKRENGQVTFEDGVNSHLLSNSFRELLFGTALMRIYGVKLDGIFEEIALQGSTLKFPFSSEKRRVYPFSLEDAVKLISIL